MRSPLEINRWSSAVAHLIEANRRWIPLVDRIGPCLLRPRRDRFGTLVRAIIGQQISSKAAASIDRRLRTLSGGPHRPEKLLSMGAVGLRSVGLSGVKAQYVLNLAEMVHSGDLQLAQLGRWSDERIVESLTKVKGVGVWTAEMFLIFALNRPDVLPAADLGVRTGLRRYFGLEELPKPRDCISLSEPWRPFRTVAMWYLWRDLDSPASGSTICPLNQG